MKKILLIAAMAFLSVSGFAQKFAHVNSTELVQLCPESDQVRATMVASQKEASDTYQAMADEFNAKYQQYQQKASTWTPAIKESKEKELTEIQQRIQEFSQSIEAELQQQQQQLWAPIYQKVNETIQTLAKKGGYIYVFDVPAALYIDDTQSVDITPEARKVLGVAEGRTLETLQQELMAQQQAAQQTAQE